MHGFLTLSSMFVASVVLAIVNVANGNPGMAFLPIVGALVTGLGIAKMMTPPLHHHRHMREQPRPAAPAKTLRPRR